MDESPLTPMFVGKPEAPAVNTDICEHKKKKR